MIPEENVLIIEKARVSGYRIIKTLNINGTILFIREIINRIK
jgi:mRNA-degrading endonuclease RelE of RelBE toxin-antitoxin system